MNLQFLNIDSKVAMPKATIHITGKLGFNMEAAKLMGFGEDTHYKVAVDNANGHVDKLYLVAAKLREENTVRVAKAGQYYYINLANVFRELGMDYEKFTISFAISKGQYEDKVMFILARRTKKEKLRDSSDKEAETDDV